MQLLPLPLKDMVQDYLKEKMRFFCTVFLDQVYVVFFLENKEEGDKVLYHLDQVCKIEQPLKAVVTAAVGKVCTMDTIHTSFEESMDAMEYRTILGGGQVLYINDIEPCAKENVVVTEYDFRQLVHAVKVGRRDEISEAIQKLMEGIRRENITPGQYELLFMELLSELVKVGRSYKLSPSQIFGRRKGHGMICIERFL